MPKYLIEASYRSEGVSGLLKEGGSSRRSAIDVLCQSLEGSLDAFYFTFGERDVVFIADLPDNASAAALAFRINATNAASCRTSVLLTPEEIDSAVTLSTTYRPPGVDLPAEVVKWEGEGGHLAPGA